MENNWMPMKEQNRIVWIDIIRGFAIFGIFTVNIGAFSAPYFIYGGAEIAWSSPLEQFVQFFIDVFFQGSFYTLFSILFGFSWQLMKDRLAAKGINNYTFLFRRQLILVGIGMVHAFLIWHGDILLSYGLVGLLLLLFIEMEKEKLLKWALFLFIGSVSLITLLLFQVRFLLGSANVEMIERAIENYSSANPFIIWGQNLHDWSMINSWISFIFMILTLLPLFMLGMYLARKGWVHQPKEHQDLLWRALQITFILFVLFKFVPYIFGNPEWFTYVQDNIGGTASALFYIVSITILVQYPIGLKLLQPFKYVGRMALSNYILQSVFCFILFYGVGFGLYDKVSPPMTLLIAVLFFIFQVLISRWWLSKFRFGPLEWLWRTLSYKKKQPLKKCKYI